MSFDAAKIDLRFTSGNSVPVERAHITAEEWAAIKRQLAPMHRPSSAKFGALEACPFCGHDAIQVVTGLGRGITMMRCATCDATVSFGHREHEKDTIAAWNHRTPAGLCGG